MEGFSRSAPFEKWEGLGNDFVLMDARHVEHEPSASAIARICDRHTGVGADGVLIVDRSATPNVMVVRNADGSRPEMCGNGLRCVAGYLLAQAHTEEAFPIRTDAGIRVCKVALPTMSDGTYVVEAGMGTARECGDLDVTIDDRTHRFASVSMGNPHAVTFEGYDDAAFDRIARHVERAVEGGTNVERVRTVAGEGVLDVTVWERGVGYTRACGTGACAVAVVACRRGLVAFDAWQTVRLPGGDLEVLVVAQTLDVRLRGPARRVFAGTI